ncbi:MAG: MBL fold metallo-hydrolase [Acidothermaceae bacterium]
MRMSLGPVEIHAIETTTLGDRSYLMKVGRQAAVIDAQRDIDRVQSLAETLDIEISHVLETHLHNDYVSGGHALREATGATYLMNSADEVAFAVCGLNDGDCVNFTDGVRLRALATPGHTYHHLSYLVEADGRPIAVFTGGSLLFGATGRTDLLGAQSTEELARAQWHSARRLAGVLPAEAVVLPTHGFGSFCSATVTDSVSTSTIKRERTANSALTDTESAFVVALLDGLDAYPTYYARMADFNSCGAPATTLATPGAADAGELRRRLENGEWLIDLRTRTAYATGHVAGSLNFDLEGNLATYLGWLMPWETPFTLLGANGEQISQAQRELSRIGIDRVSACAVGDARDWSISPLQQTRMASFAELADEWPNLPGRQRREAEQPGQELVVLDVRRRTEWEREHLENATHIPIHELPDRLSDVPAGQVWVHCATGYRSATGASLLLRAGRDAVIVDDDFDNAARAGLRVSSGAKARERRQA